MGWGNGVGVDGVGVGSVLGAHEAGEGSGGEDGAEEHVGCCGGGREDFLDVDRLKDRQSISMWGVCLQGPSETAEGARDVGWVFTVQMMVLTGMRSVAMDERTDVGDARGRGRDVGAGGSEGETGVGEKMAADSSLCSSA